MAKGQQQDPKKGPWRFWRSNLSTIIWNPKTDSPLADFTSGHFTTSDPAVAAELRSKGYLEVPLDTDAPPEGIVIREKSRVVDTTKQNIPIVSQNASPRMVEARMEKLVSDSPAPETQPPALRRIR